MSAVKMNTIDVSGKEYIPLLEYAKLVGYTSNTAYKYCSDGIIPTIKVGKRIYVPKEELDKNIEKVRRTALLHVTKDTYRDDVLRVAESLAASLVRRDALLSTDGISWCVKRSLSLIKAVNEACMEEKL
jgi:predicted site-specific integrase-resolvase